MWCCVSNPGPQLLAQPLLDFFGDEAYGVHSSDVHPVFVAVGTEFHPQQVPHRYDQEILAMYPDANRANRGMRLELRRLNLLACKK